MEDTTDLWARARAGDSRSIARLLSLVEDQPRAVPRFALAGSAAVVGITGAPGVGKSTLTAALVAQARAEKQRVAVLAVDPTSPFSGGALLGDRIRMQQHTLDEGVFIRSMATRGHLGGLAAATPQSIRLLDALGFDLVIVETVGVGQSEVEIAAHADTTLVLLAPGMGDAVQAAKAGLLEIGDIYIVNKADRDGAEQTAKEIREAIALGTPRAADEWRQRVVLTSAERGEGVREVAQAIADHREWLAQQGLIGERWRQRTLLELRQAVLAGLATRQSLHLTDLAERVEAGELSTIEAADRVLHER